MEIYDCTDFRDGKRVRFVRKLAGDEKTKLVPIRRNPTKRYDALVESPWGLLAKPVKPGDSFAVVFVVPSGTP